MKMIMDERVLEWPDQMSEESFLAFCAANPGQQIERDKHGNILIMSPTNFESGRYESAVIIALGNWNNKVRTGYVLSSSTGFTLPNGAVRCPDAAWVSKRKMDALPASERHTFAHICPDFVVEIRSKTDQVQVLQLKMREYMENGALLGFLIDPYDQKAYIYSAGSDEPEIAGDFTATISGGTVLPGFELSLQLFNS